MRVAVLMRYLGLFVGGVVPVSGQTTQPGGVGAAQNGSNSSGSGWGSVWGMFSAPNLKEFVDGGSQPVQTNPRTTGPGGAASMNGIPLAGGHSSSTPPPLMHNASPGAPPSMNAPPPSGGHPCGGNLSHVSPPTSSAGHSSAFPPPVPGGLRGSHSTGDLYSGVHQTSAPGIHQYLIVVSATAAVSLCVCLMVE